MQLVVRWSFSSAIACCSWCWWALSPLVLRAVCLDRSCQQCAISRLAVCALPRRVWLGCGLFLLARGVGTMPQIESRRCPWYQVFSDVEPSWPSCIDFRGPIFHLNDASVWPFMWCWCRSSITSLLRKAQFPASKLAVTHCSSARANEFLFLVRPRTTSMGVQILLSFPVETAMFSHRSTWVSATSARFHQLQRFSQDTLNIS